MNAGQKVIGFALAAGLVFAAAIGVGRWVGPIEGDAPEHGHEEERVTLSPVGSSDGSSVPQAGSLDLASSVHDAGRQELRFTIRDSAGAPVTSYDVVHEKLLHLVVVRRDLGGYRHVHPRLDESSGEWTAKLDLDAGSWRAYADYQPTGGQPVVAEADLSVAGEFTPAELDADNATATVDGFDVHLARDGDDLALHVTRDGEEVADLEPYLGAYGHLVAIRADDLTYLHVHPQPGEAGPEVAFHAGLGSSGRYRLFFEFQHGGVVHRAEFTVTAGSADEHPQQSPNHEEGESDEHQH